MKVQILVVSQEFNFYSNNLFKGIILLKDNLPSKVPRLQVMYITAMFYTSSVKTKLGYDTISHKYYSDQRGG